MLNETEPTKTAAHLWARPGYPAVLGVVLFVSLMLSGCALECVIPGGSCRPRRRYIHCEHIQTVQKTIETPFGWVALFHAKHYCDGITMKGSHNSIVGFFKDEPTQNVHTSWEQESACSSCELQIVSDSPVSNIDLKTADPHWLRVSADLDSSPYFWDYIIGYNSVGIASFAQCAVGQQSAAGCEPTHGDDEQCERPLTNETPDFNSCVGMADSFSLARMTETLNNPTVMDEEVLEWVDAHRDDPVKVVAGLSYFHHTWDHPSGERSGSTIESMLKLAEDFDCSAALAAGQSVWMDYIVAIDRILTAERRVSALEPCVGRLDAQQLKQLEDTRSRSSRQK